MIRILNSKGFTYTEILVVLLLVGLLTSIALPNIWRGRDIAMKNTCMANLKQIKGAVNVWWASEGILLGIEKPELSNLVPVYIRNWPSCGGDDYEIPDVNTDPQCPKYLEGHEL